MDRLSAPGRPPSRTLRSRSAYQGDLAVLSDAHAVELGDERRQGFTRRPLTGNDDVAAMPVRRSMGTMPASTAGEPGTTSPTTHRKCRPAPPGRDAPARCRCRAGARPRARSGPAPRGLTGRPGWRIRHRRRAGGRADGGIDADQAGAVDQRPPPPGLMASVWITPDTSRQLVVGNRDPAR